MDAIEAPLVRVRGVAKSFGGVRALRGVDLEVLPGEVHALLGENGAGKSTLIKILSGVHDHDAGTIEVGGVPTRFRSPAQSREAGIAVVYQDLSLVESLSVADNLLLGREPRTRWGLLRKRRILEVEIACAQLALLPALAVILNLERVDARVVCLLGFLCLLAAAVGCSRMTIYWRAEQFYPWQGIAAVGQAMIVMPVLMLSTNTVRAKVEAPWASAAINFPRAVAEVVAIWLINLVSRWRDALHSDRIVDQVASVRWPLIQGSGILRHHPPPLLPGGDQSAAGSLNAFSNAVEQQVQVLTMGDMFLVFAGLVTRLIILTLIVPVRSRPPRSEAVAVE